MPVRLAEIRRALEAAYPTALAEPWDSGIGLTCGDPGAAVDSVVLAVDVDPITVDEAVEVGAQLLVTHHPLLFRAVQSVAADTPKGGLIHRMLRHGIGHYAAHTNADRATGGVNDALAAALGLTDIRPLQAAPGPAFDKLVVMVPRTAADALLDALSAAGAGRVGDYSHAAFRVDGIGQFQPLDGAHPTVGEVGRIEQVEETRIDMVLSRGSRDAVVAALHAAHPYEEPGFDLTEMVRFGSTDAGLGRIGLLAAPVTAAEFAELVATVLPATVTGARLAGDPARQVSTVAVCGGAGGSLLDDVAGAGVDAFLTADLSHHTAADFVADPRHPVLVDVAHWASEWPWLPRAAEVLRTAFGAHLRVTVSTRRTDPWTARGVAPAR